MMRPTITAMMTALLAVASASLVSAAVGLGQLPLDAPPGASGAQTASARCLSVIPGLDQRQRELDSHIVTYSVVSYGARSGEMASFELPLDAEAPDRVDLIKVATVFKSGLAYRVHEQTIWTRRGPEEANATSLFTSDGAQFHTRFAKSQGGHSTVMFDLNDSMHRVGPQMDAYGWRVLGQVAPLDFQQYMRWGAASADLRVESNVGGKSGVSRASWRFLPDLPQTRVTATIDDRTSALSTIQMDVHSGDATLPGAKVMLRKSVSLYDYTLGGKVVSGARVVDQLNGASEEWPAAWSVAIVTPIAIERAPCTRERIYITPNTDDLVQDARFDIAYRPDEARVNLDGLVVPLAQNPMGDVGWQLDQWVSNLPPLKSAVLPLDARSDESSVPSEAIVFDAGTVLVDEQPARAEHSFMIHNDSTVAWRVKDVVKSCGCLTCDISTRSIAPGADAVLSIAMSVPAPGERRQHVAVVFEDGTIMKFELRARGHSQGSLRVLTDGFTERDGLWRADLRAYWVESDPASVQMPVAPLTIGDSGSAILEFSGWTLIEPPSTDGQRPRKLFGRGAVTLTQPPASSAWIGKSLSFAAGASRSCSLPIVVAE